jgi:hypothetical protein
VIGCELLGLGDLLHVLSLYSTASPEDRRPKQVPMHYGKTLADFNKVAQVPCQTRLAVIAADERYMSYLRRSGRDLLPLSVGGTTMISKSSLHRLSTTAKLEAQGHGEWTRLQASPAWSSQVETSYLFAWEVIPGITAPL